MKLEGDGTQQPDLTKHPYKFLMQPGYIGKVLARNRIYKSAAGMMMCDQDEVRHNPITFAFYEALARGGVGIISVEAPTIDYPLGARWRQRYRMDEDRFVPGMAELVERIHDYGCPVFMQIEHDGPWQSPLFNNGPPTFDGPPMAASRVNITKLGDRHRDMPRSLTVPEIKEITLKYINAAERARRAGFDGVDINCGSSHLIHNFLSPFWNRREDEYGGSQRKRAKLMVDIIQGVKARCGTDFPVVTCINGFENGYCIDTDDSACLTHDLATQSVLMAVEAGADALMIRSHWLGLHVAGFLPDYMFYPEAHVPPGKMPRQYYWKERGRGAIRLMAEEYKRLVSVPLILVGYMEPEPGESILKEGHADFIGMNRPLICDPELPNKLMTGRREDIAPCTRCGTCLDQSETFLRHCRLNASVGTDSFVVDPAPRRRKVVVVGGGPAGMEAARVSALRGHDVTLIEKSSRLGGLLPLAALIKGTELEDLPGLVRYLDSQITGLGVKVKLRTTCTPDAIRQIQPDIVFVATGGLLSEPKVDGAATRKILTIPELHRRVKPWLSLFGPRFLGWVTKVYLPVGRKVVVIGAGVHGMEVAEFLVKRHRKVTVVESSDRIGEGVLDFRLGLLMDWFARKKVSVIAAAQDIVVTKRGVSYTDDDGARHDLRARTVIPTSPIQPDRSLADALEGAVGELYVIGDSSQPGMTVHAIRAAHQAARKL